ncbi:MAG TPA: hypothetical protein PLL54_06035 [Dermatophilaceae bacterium]|nr:hypothetical protein [Dermatophilaceae bacterium]
MPGAVGEGQWRAARFGSGDARRPAASAHRGLGMPSARDAAGCGARQPRRAGISQGAGVDIVVDPGTPSEREVS